MESCRLRILLIDDDEDEYVITRDLLSEIEGSDFNLEWVSTYERAIEAMEKERFDVYLVDYRLGEYTGLDLLQEAVRRGFSAPIILLTGQGDRAVDIEAMKAGAADYLDKGEISASFLERSIRYAVEQHRLQAKLKASEQQLATIIAHNADGMVIVDRSGIIRFVNPAAEFLFGCAQNELLGQTFAYPLVAGETIEIDIEQADGKMILAEMRVVELNWKGEIVYLASLRDITEKKALQDQLIRSERLAATGQLAASIAHEINSPLQGITSLLSIIGKTYESDKVLAENIDLLKGAFASIRDTVKHLLDLNRPGNIRKQSVNVNEIIERTVALFRSHLKKNRVKVNFVLFPKLPNTYASPQQLSQIFMNLINNAIEAISGKTQSGNTRKLHKPVEGEINIRTYMNGDTIVIEVADTGPGIAEKDLKYIFDPFYTRKKTMGMGVGLSICYGIIEDHKGRIKAENSPDGGAQFIITLPAERPEDFSNTRYPKTIRLEH